ncbi:50S ribosomal protein L3 N(5)-glutamine methyltransferase [Halospina sp. K52047b]|uniref:50S ribosomal protein L3 N(5)-glutamine methyltransferase n=1 Tax=Halospina sp. K52047b TaxID=2614160 RepID=UPI00124A268C|nr:50S ribosomal protein L3 N(5)-glutamine methyltransferase [Halospina sp. K52047b]KAA8984612.1 50S ribosomal protein L3 N(5)-glutamine methyltransferase [Halospina sp. K52047b]
MSTEAIEQLQTVRDWLRYAVSRFTQAGVWCGHGTDSHWDDAVQLLMQTLHLPMDNNVPFLDARLTLSEREQVLERIERRARDRVPVPYITGEAFFMGLRFHVDERVLIPRSPIGEFLATEGEPWLAGRPVERILDLCAGSGCIGIAAAHVFPAAQVDLGEVSPGAVEVAEQNIRRHGLEGQVRAVASDLFEKLDGPYDLILANPPYVDARDMATLPPEYRHEPELGLAAGEDGLELMGRILREAPAYLSEDGLLVGEVGNSQPALEAAFPSVPFTWLEMENGGHGVFVVDAQTLAQAAPLLNG